MKITGRLCVITDTVIQKKYSHLKIAEMALKGGADMIQLRDKSMPSKELADTASKIKKLCGKYKALFIVNDRVDIAVISGADGVHLGKDDIPVPEARKLLGSKKIIGGTAHSLKEAVQRVNEGANYIGFGHIYATGSKHKPGKPKGAAYLKLLVKKIKIPVFAIGGITLDNIDEVMQTGVHGTAVIGGVLNTADPVKAVKEFKKKIYGG